MLGIQKQKIQPQLLGAHCSVWRQSNKQAITPWCDKCYHSGKQGMPWDCRGDTGGTSEPFSPGGGGQEYGKNIPGRGSSLYINLKDSWFVPGSEEEECEHEI